MGLDYSYLLYFKREHMWEALQGVVELANLHRPPVRIRFPDHDLSIPLETWSCNNQQFQHDDPGISFSTALNFDRDEAIREYLIDQGDDDNHRSPPGVIEEGQVMIGYIYLTIQQELPGHPSQDLALFEFKAATTNMSVLFDHSTSIRKTFIELLEKFQGVCGVFNKEMYGDLFWLKRRHLSEEIADPYMVPDEIETLLAKRR
jgi:hypothetical protein